MKKTFLLFSFILLVSCSSVQNYTNNDLNKDYYKSKTLIFSIHPSSQQHINLSGPSAGYFIQPDVKEAFKEALTELSKETKLDLRFEENDDANVLVKITAIDWKFKLSSAEMTTKINFITNNEEHPSTGTFKNFSGGSEKNNLRKSFKNAIYNFLMELPK